METQPSPTKVDGNRINRRSCDLTVSKKLEIIYAVDIRDKPKTEIAREYGIPVSTLASFLKNRTTLEKAAAEGKDKQKRLRGAKYHTLEKELITWYKKTRNNNEPISGMLVREKAAEIAFRRGLDFKPSNGWLQRFQNRYDITSLSAKIIEPPTVAGTRDNCYDSVKPILEKYTLRNIFTCGELGLFYNLTPDGIEEIREDICFEGNRSEDRMTMLVACNANGTEKLKPVMVAKYNKPQCLEGVPHTPLHYKSDGHAWMTKEIFLSWLKDLEKQMSHKNRHILLLMDRSSVHNHEALTLNYVRILYLPTNDLTFTLLPLEQGIFLHLKHLYRKRLVQYYLRKIKKGVPITEIRKWSILDAMRNMAVSWGSLDKEVISQSFLKCGLGNNTGLDVVIKTIPEEFDEWSELQCFMDCPPYFEDFANVDNSLETFANFIVEAPEIEHILDFVDVKGQQEDEEVLAELEREFPKVRDTPIPTRTEAYLAIAVLESLSHLRGDPTVAKSMATLREFVYKQYKTTPTEVIRKC